MIKKVRAALPTPESGLERIGERLRAVRKIAGIRQIHMAEVCGVEQSTWSKWEAGSRQPDLFAIMRFCRRAQVSLDLIFFGLTTSFSHPDLIQALRERYPYLLVDEKTVPDPHTDSQQSYRSAIRLVGGAGAKGVTPPQS